MKKIYIVEDDYILRTELSKLLEAYGFICQHSDDFKHIVENIISSSPDLVLLDINLPYFDGYYVCREIRKTSQVPVIVVTSRDSDMDELMSINLGADDFITKPYNKQILLARINSILKRVENVQSSDIYSYNNLHLICSKGIMKFDNKEVELSKNEIKIMSILITNRGKIVSREEIINELWQTDEFIDDNTLTVNINRLRKKLDSIGAGEYIKTKRGQGYCL